MLKRGDTFEKLARNGLNTPYNLTVHALKTVDTVNLQGSTPEANSTATLKNAI